MSNTNTDTEIIKLNQKEAEWFFDLIDNPPETNDAIKKAFVRHNSKKVEGKDSTFKID